MLAIDNDASVAPPWPGCKLAIGMQGLEQLLREERMGFGSLGVVVAIGGSRGSDRIKIEDELSSRGAAILEVRHPTANVCSSAVFGSGCQLLMGSIVGSAVRLGRSVIINSGAQVDHDCVVEDGVHVGPGAVVAGETKIGRNAFIGAGAVVLPRVTLGQNVVVGAGAVVTSDVAGGLVVTGSPAREVRHVAGR